MFNFKDFDGFLVEKVVPKEEFIFRFVDTFTYNKVELDQEYKEELKKLDEIESFIKENSDPESMSDSVKEARIISIGYASWVPTDYSNEGNYEEINNFRLAEDRGKAISKEFKKDFLKFCKRLGLNIDENEIEIVKSKGKVDKGASRKVLLNFVRLFENDTEDLVRQMMRSKNENDKQAPPVVKIGENEYNMQNDDPQEIYDAIIEHMNDEENASYVRFTSQLKYGKQRIENKYAQATQKAIIKITINPSEKPKSQPSDEPKKPKKSPLDPITFKTDSKNYDSNGVKAYKKLVEYLRSIKPEEIRNVLLLGHAEGSEELGIDSFNPQSRKTLFDKNDDKVKSQYNEMQLEDTRFILSWGRVKKVYIDLQRDIPEIMNKLIDNKSFWIQAFGTQYSNYLDNQRIVQIAVWNEGSKSTDINTNDDLNLGSSPADKTSVKLYRLLGHLGYNETKFLRTFAVGQKARQTQLFNNFMKDIMTDKDNGYMKFKQQYN